MTRARYGWLAGIAGAAIAAWYWRSRHAGGGRSSIGTGKGEVIFRNSPLPSNEGIL